MTAFDGLQLDADGFVDMDQFPDDDLPEADLSQLRDALHSDPVEEPTAEQWDAMFDEVLASDDSGPFAVDDGDAVVTDDDATPDGTDDGVGADTDAESETDADADADADVDVEVDAEGDLFGLDGTDDVDLGLDGTDVDAGLDLAPDDTVDDAFSPDALDDAPADIANNDFEDLL